jgi:hypothetical protein
MLSTAAFTPIFSTPCAYTGKPSTGDDIIAQLPRQAATI